ncbi:sigma-70 family RNA polymerase sigma factor [Candidatus Cyanaurora vandensis]|uniref:sigma-70 family RNA polymerase sigma factor n=1 Tax=Candidatus Cyanaurora vandensis TaxID=2714958 RepID=UPI00257EBEF3|nr:sigma-70 family RNA polymerase sigma factor [Candidatus Cyanaurora vandensis]
MSGTTCAIPVPAHPPKRQDPTTQFCTFLDIGRESWAWREEPRLRRNLAQYLSTAPPSLEVWVSHWLGGWRKDILARQHLIAYLQEPCYWAAWKTEQWVQRGAGGSYDLAELFQIALLKTDIILHKYNPRLGSNLKGYAFQAFKNCMRDEVQKQTVVALASDWSLLRQTSRELLTQALRHHGLPEATIHTYLLVWQIYRDCYVPRQPQRVTRLTGPDPVLWQTISERYNREISPSAQPAELSQWLLVAAQAIRNFRPRFTSLDFHAPDQESLVDRLVAPGSSPFEQLQYATEQQYFVELAQVLRQALAQLPPAQRELLELYYGQGLGQKELARLLQKNQCTISRQLTQCRGQLVVALGQWSNAALHIQITPGVLKELGAAVDQWLTENYQSAQQLQEFSPDE